MLKKITSINKNIVFLLLIGTCTQFSVAAEDALFSAIHNNHIEAITDLLNAGADSKMLDQWGMTPLHYTVWKGYPEAATLLLKHGADANQDYESNSILSTAILFNQPEVVKILLEHGANANGEGDLRFAILYKQVEIIKILLEYGANPLIEDKYCMTAIDWARNKPEIIELLENAMHEKVRWI